MKKSKTTLQHVVCSAVISVLLFSSVALADQADPCKKLPSQTITKLKTGEVYLLENKVEESEGEIFVQAVIMSDRPVDVIWSLLKIPENQHRYLPGLDSARLVTRDDNSDLVGFYTKIWYLNFDFQLKYFYKDKERHLWWHLDRMYDNDINRLDGSFRLYRYDENYTCMHLSTLIEVPIIPDWLIKTLVRYDLPENLEAVQKYIQSGGTYTKPTFNEN